MPKPTLDKAEEKATRRDVDSACPGGEEEESRLDLVAQRQAEKGSS